MKPDFSDFYKFIVSVGLILISLALLIPWAILQEDFYAQLPLRTIDTLAPLSKELILNKQQIGLLLIRNIGWSSLILFLIGLAFVTIGLFRWYTRQIVLDKKQDFEVKKAEIEIVPLNPNQIAQKTLEQMGIQQSYDKDKPNLSEVNVILAKYLYVLRHISKNIREYIEQYEYSVLENQKIGDYNYDILLIDKSDLRDVDGIMSIRYCNGPIQQNWIKEEIGQAIILAETYMRNKPSVNLATSLLVIAPATFLPQISVDEYKSKLEINPLAHQLDIVFVSEEELNQNNKEFFQNLLNKKIVGLLNASNSIQLGNTFPFRAGIIISLVLLISGFLGSYIIGNLKYLMVSSLGVISLSILVIMFLSWKKLAILIFQELHTGATQKYELASWTNSAEVSRSFLTTYSKSGIKVIKVKLYIDSNNIQRHQMIVYAQDKRLTFDIKPNTPIIIDHLSIKLVS